MSDFNSNKSQGFTARRPRLLSGSIDHPRKDYYKQLDLLQLFENVTGI